MKFFSLMTIALFYASHLYAGTVALTPGEEITVNANTPTTIQCSGSSTPPAKTIEYKFCECQGASVATFRAYMTIKYAGANPEVTIIKEYWGDVNGESKCKALIASMADCR